MANTKITTNVIADDAITLAKMAGIARGKIIYGDSSGNPAVLAVGSAGTVLTSDGTDISWAEEVATNYLPLAGGTMTGNLTLNGADIVKSGSADLTIDVGGRINLSADDNGEVRLYDGSSLYGQFKDDDDRLTIQGLLEDKDMLFVVNDGGTATTAMKLNAASGGNATFYAPNLNITADDARLLIEETDGTDIVWLGDLTGAGVGGCFLYNHGGTATVQLRADNTAGFINNAADFGIGTASPTSKLTVSDAGDGNTPTMHIIDTSDTEVAWFEGHRAGDTGAFISIYHNPSSIAESNRAGLRFQGGNDAGQKVNYGMFLQRITDYTDGTEDGEMQFHLMSGGTLEEKIAITPDQLRLKGDAGSSFIRVDNRADGHDTGFEIYQNASRKWELHSDDSNTDALDIRNNSGTSKFTFTQAGELGIGYTNPGAFHANYRNLVVGSGSGDEGMIIYSGASNAGSIAFARDAAANSDSYDGYIEYNQADRSMRFAANAGGERMRLNNTGLGIGTGSPSTKLYVYNQGGGNGDCMTVQSGSTANANVGMIIFRDNDQDYCGQITTNGSTNTAIYNANTSDERLKENITDWDIDALALFKNIEPKEFNFKSQDEGAPKVRGYIAQTETSKFPEAFTTDASEEAYYSYNPGGMVIYLMKALKEQVAINEALEARITALEG